MALLTWHYIPVSTYLALDTTMHWSLLDTSTWHFSNPQVHNIVYTQYDPALGEGGASKDLTVFGGEGRGGGWKQCVIVYCPERVRWEKEGSREGSQGN